MPMLDSASAVLPPRTEIAADRSESRRQISASSGAKSTFSARPACRPMPNRKMGIFTLENSSRPNCCDSQSCWT